MESEDGDEADAKMVAVIYMYTSALLNWILFFWVDKIASEDGTSYLFPLGL